MNESRLSENINQFMKGLKILLFFSGIDGFRYQVIKSNINREARGFLVLFNG